MWHFKPFIKNRLSQYECQKRKIIRINDFKYIFGEWIQLNDGQLITDEVFEVVCKRNGRPHYDNLFVQIVNKLNNSVLNVPKTSNKCKPMNVILISYDSVSRPSWFKRAPKATSFALDTMKFELLSGYNIVGDGTPAALIPIYAGKTEEELPSVLKNDPKGRYVDEAYP